MKKILVLILIVFFLGAYLGIEVKDSNPKEEKSLEELLKMAEGSGGKWSDYEELTSGNIVDADDFLVRDVSDNTLGATGTQKRYSWAALKVDLRDFQKINLTEDTSITSAQIIANKYITNQGDAGEADLTLPAVSYAVVVIFVIEEVLNIEINPPAGEAFDLDGTTLDANDCVDSDSTVGSKISALRMQNAAGTWIWSLDSIRGTWIDRGAGD